jgi:hypothetical protein
MNDAIASRSESRPRVTGIPSPLESTLTELRGQIDLVLESLPESPAEARRVVTREFGIDPRPKELQAIARLARDPIGDASLRNLACTALSLRILAERGVQELFDSSELAAQSIGRSALLMLGLLDTVDTLETEVRGRIELLAPAERNFVLEVVEALQPAAEPLVAATVVAPRLLALVHATRKGDPRAVVPSLTDEDVETLTAAVSGDAKQQDGVGRPGMNAVVMRTIIDDDLASLERIRSLDAGESDNGARAEVVLDRLRRDRTAYRFVSRRLQERQDTALLAGLQKFAEQLRRIQRDLFSTYLKLAPVLNSVTAKTSDTETREMPDTAADLDRLLRACNLSEALAEVRRDGQVTNDELYLNALKKMDEPDAIETIVQHDPGYAAREKRRLGILYSISAVLLVACAIVYGLRFTRERVDLNVPPSELPAQLELISAMSVGPMMYAQTSHWTWNDLDEPGRRKAVERLGISAFERGFETVYLSDENERQLAIWTKLDGARISAPEPEPGI